MSCWKQWFSPIEHYAVGITFLNWVFSSHRHDTAFVFQSYRDLHLRSIKLWICFRFIMLNSELLSVLIILMWACKHSYCNNVDIFCFRLRECVLYIKMNHIAWILLIPQDMLTSPMRYVIEWPNNFWSYYHMISRKIL